MHHRRSKRAPTAAVALLWLVASGSAGAICLEPSPVRVCTEFYRSQTVVLGKILSERRYPDTPDKNNVEGWFYSLAVDKTFRGSAKGTIEIYTGNDETHFPMETGHSYLLFLNPNAQGRVAPDACGNSTDADKAADAIAAVGKILAADKTSAGGDIGGRVNLPVAGSQAMSDAGTPGVTLTAHSYVGTDQTVVTGADGRFNMHVPAGHYSLVGKSEGWDIVPYALSYMKPGDFEIADGGCADLQFLAEPK